MNQVGNSRQHPDEALATRTAVFRIAAILLALFSAIGFVISPGQAWPGLAQAPDASPTVPASSATTDFPTLTASYTATASPEPSATASSTQTHTPTRTPTSTRTVSSTSTRTPSHTPTQTALPTASATWTATVTPTPTPTATPVAATAIPTLTVTIEAASPATPAATEMPYPAKTPGPTPGPDRSSPLMLIGLGGAILAAGGILLLGAVILLLKRRRAPSAATTPAGGISIGSEAASMAVAKGIQTTLTMTRPPPGLPYLESQNRTQGTVYYPITTSVVRVGRGTDNDLVIDDSFDGWQTVSRHHATIEQREGAVVVVDQGAQNGVHVNDRRTSTNVLKDLWRVRFGQVEFIYRENR